MTKDNTNPRRQFLRNMALGSLTVAVLPVLSTKAASTKTSNSGACNPTTLDLYGQGPFYTANAPTLNDNQLADENEAGTPLILSGRVQTLDCTKVIPDTIIDIWHANDAGQYDNAGYNLRGKVLSNAQGFYTVRTILPGKYLNGSKYRPSHIHFKIVAPGFDSLTTQLYFEGDSDIPSDAAASESSGTYDASHRIIPITLNTENEYEGTWDIAVDGNGVDTSISNLHADKGMIYSVSPNPFTDTITIEYGVFQDAKVTVEIYNEMGMLMAVLEEQQLTKQKYQANWQAGAYLASGIYFVCLKINDLQVHYQKIVKL
jgi:protocatechuate 3,4-dioxygenase beta subunit